MSDNIFLLLLLGVALAMTKLIETTRETATELGSQFSMRDSDRLLARAAELRKQAKATSGQDREALNNQAFVLETGARAMQAQGK